MTSTNSRSEPGAVIINGFDRSGASAIVRTLAQHPAIEIFMQPFNSGPIRRRMNRIWDARMAEPADTAFFKGLEARRLDKNYIVSHWFHEDSTATDFVEGRLHVIKTTINHFAFRWIRDEFPGLDQWAIWREPIDILASLIRNGFAEKWYSGAAAEVAETVREEPELREVFGRFAEGLDHPHLQMAFVIAMRNWFLFRHVDPRNVLIFEDFIAQGPGYLRRFADRYGLAPFEFAAAGDLNITGRRHEPGVSHASVIDPAALPEVEAVFAPLLELRERRFGAQV